MSIELRGIDAEIFNEALKRELTDEERKGVREWMKMKNLKTSKR